MRSSRVKKPLTRAEIAAAYRRRQATEKRTELRELVALAYELGRKSKTVTPIPAGRLLSHLRELREATKASKTSKRAAAYLALLTDTKPTAVKGASIKEIRAAFDLKTGTAEE